MLYGKEVYRSIQLTDDIQTSTLGIVDQLRLIAASVSNDDVAELSQREQVITDKLKTIAAFRNFLDHALQQMHDLGKNSVTLKVSHVFKPYFQEVLYDEHTYGRYYDCWIEPKDLPMNVKHYIEVKIWKKGD